MSLQPLDYLQLVYFLFKLDYVKIPTAVRVRLLARWGRRRYPIHTHIYIYHSVIKNVIRTSSKLLQNRLT